MENVVLIIHLILALSLIGTEQTPRERHQQVHLDAGHRIYLHIDRVDIDRCRSICRVFCCGSFGH